MIPLLLAPLWFTLACDRPEPPSVAVQPATPTPEVAPPPPPPGQPVSSKLSSTAAALALEEALLAWYATPTPTVLEAVQAQAAQAVQADPGYSYLRLLWGQSLALGGESLPGGALDPAEQAWFDAWFQPHRAELPALLHAHRVHACLQAEGRQIPDFLLRSGEGHGGEPLICGGMRLDPGMCPDDYSIFERFTLRSRGRDRLESWSGAEQPFGVAELAAMIGLTPGMRMADLGAGVGWLAMPFARLVGPKGVVHALEIDPYALELLGQLARQPGLEALHPVASRPDHTTLAPASVDLIFVCDTFKAILREELEDPVTFHPLLVSAAAALAPGGRLVVIEKPDAPTMHRPVSMERLQRAIEDAGFVLVQSPATLEPGRRVMIFALAQGG